MDYIVSGHKYVDDVVSMLMMFYPNEKYTQVDEVGDNFTVVSVLSKNTASAHVLKRQGNNIRCLYRSVWWCKRT